MDRAGIARTGTAALVLVAMAFARAGAAQTPQPPQSIVRPTTTASFATTGIVVGMAWKGDSTPFPQARIRLRNVQTGRGMARTESDAEGRFRFDRVEPGLYVVELLSDQDRVLAVGDLFSVIAGGEVRTFVRLSSKAPWFGGFFGSAAAAVISAASTLGVTAVGSGGRPVSPQ